MADTVKNVTFKFKADTSQLTEAIAKINAELEKAKGGLVLKLDTSKLKEGASAVSAEYKKLIGADNEYKKKTIAGFKEIKAEQEKTAKQITKDKKAEYQKLITADNDYIRQVKANAQKQKQELAQINRQQTQDAARTAREQARGQARAIPVTGAAPAGGNVGFGDALKGGLAAFGIVATAEAMVDLGKSTVQAAIDFEKLTTSFRALIGDKTRADQAIKDIQQFALETPFDVTQIAAAGKTLLGYGINVEQLIPTLKTLGDVSAASGGDIQRVALAYGQVSSKGKLQGEEIRQLVNVGFNPLQEISKVTGETMAALAKRVEEGKVSFVEVAEAFRVATSEGGRFFNLAASLNDTFGGQLQKLTEQINLFKIEVGTTAAEDLRPLVEQLVKFFSILTEGAKSLRENSIQLGILKGVLGFLVALLFKSANALLLNVLQFKSFNNVILSAQRGIIAFSLGLKINTFAIGNNTTAQKAAAIATTLWDATTKAVTVSVNFLGASLKALWATMANNPIGLIILAYQVLNGILDENKKKTRVVFLEEQGLADFRKQKIATDLQAAGATKAVQGSLDDQLRLIEETARKYGFLSAETKKLVNELAEQQGINLDIIQGYKDQIKWGNELRKVIRELQQREALKINVDAAQENLDNLRKAIGETEKKLFDFREQEFGKFSKEAVSGAYATPLLQFLPFDVTKNKYLKEKNDQKEKNDLFIKELIELTSQLEAAQNNLADAQTRLLAQGTIGGAAKPQKEKDLFKQEKDALADLRKFIQGLIDDIDKLNSKRISLQIDQLPDFTEQEQKLKAQARFDEQTRINKKERAAEIRRATELYRLAIKEGADKEEARRLYGEALLEIDERSYSNQRIANLNFAQEMEEIGRKWREEDLKNLQEYTDNSLKILLDGQERALQGREELLDNTIQDFEKAPIGQGKKYRQLIKLYASSVQQSITDIEKTEEKAALIRYDREVDLINKKYKFERKAYTGAAEGKEAFENEQDQLKKKVDAEKENALRNAETKKQAALTAIAKKGADDRDKASASTTSKTKAADSARKNRIIDEIQQTIDLSIQAAQTLIDLEMRKNDELIALQEQRVQKAKEIADKGNAALLEAEEKRLNELQKKRARFVRAQQALILAQTIAESALAIAKAAVAGEGWASAITVAATIAALAAGFAQARAQSTEAIGGFSEGGWTGKGGKLEPAGIVHKEEFVVKKGPAEKFKPILEQMNRGRDPFLAAGMGQQVIMINNVGVEERLARIEKAITGQDRMNLTIDESGIHGIVSHYQWKNQRIRNKTR